MFSHWVGEMMVRPFATLATHSFHALTAEVLAHPGVVHHEVGVEFNRREEETVDRASDGHRLGLLGAAVVPSRTCSASARPAAVRLAHADEVKAALGDALGAVVDLLGEREVDGARVRVPL